MRAARRSAFIVAILLSTGLAADTTPPLITPHVSGTLGGGGWYTSDVTLTWSVTDDESPVLFTSGCGTTVMTADHSGRSFTCSATSLGGTSSVTTTIKRDTAGPTVDFTGNAGTYTVDQTVLIFCNTFDALSGVAMTTCGTPITGAAYDFPLETPVTQFATAVDNAGNSTTATLVFTVDVTYDGVSALIDQMGIRDSVARSLQRSLETAELAELAGRVTAELRALEQFTSRVSRESGKSLTAAQADLLLRLAQHL